MTTNSGIYPHPAQPALRRRWDAVGRALAFRAKTPAQHAQWRKALRAKLRELTGFDTMRPAPLKPKIAGRTQHDGYSREHVTIQTEAGVFMTLYVLIPNAGPGPFAAVIAPHGHGSGGKVATCGIRDNPAVSKAIDVYNYDYAVQLVRAGFITFAPDARGFGERKETTVPADTLSGSCLHLNNMGFPLGQTVAGMWAFDLTRLVDYIRTRKDCRADRIGCAGLSGGGLQTLWACAFDDRIRAVVISGYFYGYKESLLDQHQNCSCNYVPHLYEYADMGDIGALIAPRPLLIETGDQDGLNGASGLKNVTSQVNTLKRAYKLLKAPANLVHDIFPGGHKWHGTVAIPFLQAHLQDRS